MLPNLNSKNYLITITLLVMFIVGCSPIPPTSIASESTLSNFLSPTLTSTIMRTPTITLMSTQTVNTTPRPTITPSLTPLPTIPSNELSLRFEILSATNGDCRLPCFWGITPGETTIAELFQFTGQFTMTGFEMVDIGNGSYIFRYLTSQHSSSPWIVQFFSNGEKVRGIGLIAETAQYDFPLSKILSDYGVPDKVFIGPEVSNALPMQVVYEGQHILGISIKIITTNHSIAITHTEHHKK